MPRVRVVGRGRAGSAFVAGLSAAGWEVTDATAALDLVLLAVPDGAVAEVASGLEPAADVVVAHVAGSLGLDVLAPHADRASIHPLVALPAGPTGAARLTDNAWFAVASSSERADAVARSVVDALRGQLLEVDDDRRVGYHAAACMASNHLVALLGQVERVAAAAGVPLAAYLDLVRATVDNVAELGPAVALTGPAARGDWETIRRHLAVIDPSEREAYAALAVQARRLAEPDLDTGKEPPWTS